MGHGTEYDPVRTNDNPDLHNPAYSDYQNSKARYDDRGGFDTSRHESGTFNAPPELPLKPANLLPPQLPVVPSEQQDFSDRQNINETHGTDAFGPDRDKGVDQQIGALFTAMGRASKMSRQQLAARLQTSPELITALETGTLGELPEWEDIAPIVVRYASMMNIDERPVLRRLREQLTEHFLTEMTRDKYTHSQFNTAEFNTAPVAQLTDRRAGERPRDLSGMNNRMDQASHNFAGHSLQQRLGAESSALPSTDRSLKALAEGQINSRPTQITSSPPVPSIEERFSSLVSQISHSQKSAFSTNESRDNVQNGQIGQNSQLRREDAPAGAFRSHSRSLETRSHGFQPGENQSLHQVNQRHVQAGMAQGQHVQSYGENTAHMAAGVSQDASYGAVENTGKKSKGRGKSIMLRVVGNLAFVIILLVGFINWQPNRFWSGVDQLPKPISESIYSLFEFVMPDPLASVYRMNWVVVDDPRMRKADKLAVPSVKKLPAIDFSKLGILQK